jgi:hypothetical protein
MNHPPPNDSLQTRALAVLGPFRGGTSLTCGVLQALGVFVGRQFWDARSNYCTYEALGLRNSCNACFDERPGGWQYRGTRQQRIAQLQQWMDFARRTAAANGCCGVGGKHPTLCKLVDEVAVAWRNADGQPPILISVIRPVDQVLAAWQRAREPDGKPWWPRADRDRIVADLIDSRDRALEGHPHLRVDFASLLADPATTIKRLAADCGLPTTHLARAVKLVQRR